MVRVLFILVCGFVFGAVVMEYKHYFSGTVAIPVAFLPDGGQYDGELLKGELSDSGRIVWPNGDYYDGEFRDGLFHGLGRYKTGDHVYEGEFVAGVARGQGRIDYDDGRRYVGDVVAGLPHGHGDMTLIDGEYVGNFRQGLFHGEGTLQFSNGDRYEGEFANGEYDGKGVFTAADGKLYQGQFRQNAMNGRGDYRDDDTRYTGEFRDWLFHGEGEYEGADFTYSGQFANGEFYGVGDYQETNGSHYRGQFVEGVFHGQGVLVENGNRYEGGFEYGMQHGEGVLTYAKPLDGIAVVKGRWQYGKLVESDNPLVEHDAAKINEYVLYNQAQQLDQIITSIEKNDSERIELYFVGVAGDGSQGVFRREVNTIRDMFDRDYATAGKSALLINGNVSWQQTPLATITSFERLLNGIAEKMDAENDILFIYLTSHGSSDFVFQLQQPGLKIESLAAEKMGDIVAALPVKHKVVVISSCYSGGYVTALKDSRTLFIAAASADKTSFGCTDTAEMTYFGEAFFKDALPKSDTFVEAFDRAREIVRGREAKEGFEYSNPRIFKPDAIVQQLALWRADLSEWKKQQNRIISDQE